MKRQINYWWSSFILLSILAYLIQLPIFVYKDVLYLLHAAKLMLAGGTYTADFFETNPPMIMYLYMVPILIAKFTTINVLIVMRIYIILLAMISISLCYFCMQQIIVKNNNLRDILAYTLIFILLFLPANQFAQREHFLLILTFPYLFATVLRLENQYIHPGFAILIGIMAGIGFALKPYFLTTLLLVELFIIYKKKNLFSWIRIESIAIIGILSTYLTIVFLIHSDYIHTILPLVSRLYFIGVAEPWLLMLSLPTVLFCFVAIGFYCILRHEDQYPLLSQVLLLALLGFILSFLIPRVAWHYHVYPALGIACLLFALSFSQLAKHIFPLFSKKIINAAAVLSMIFIIFYIPLSFSLALFIDAAHEKLYGSDNNLIQFFKNSAHCRYDCFSVSDDHLLFEGYANATYTGLFPFFWWQAGLVTIQKRTLDKKSLLQIQQDQIYLANLLATSLVNKKPEFIIIDITAAKLHFGMDVDYIKEFSHSKAFRDAWKNYHYVDTISHYKVYSYLVHSPY